MVLARALSRGSGFAGPRTGSAVPEAANQRLDARRGAPLGVLDQKVRHTAIPMMNEAAAPDTPALVPGLLQRIQHNAGVSRAAGTPADKTPRQDVDEEGDREETGAGRDGGKIGQPQGVWTRCFERPLDAVERTRGRRVADCGADRFTAPDAAQAPHPHQARPGATSDRDPFPEKRPPDLPDAIDPEGRLGHAPDFGSQGDIAPGPCRQLARIGAPSGMGVRRRRGDRQNAADRLDPVASTGRVDKGDHGLNRRSNAA